MKCIRVISKAQPVTFDDAVAEREVDLDVIGLNATRNAARFAQQGDYSRARLYNLEQADLMKRAARTETQLESMAAWAPQQRALEEQLQVDMVQELDEGIALEDADDAAPAEKEVQATNFLFRKARRNDDKANKLYQMASKSAKKYVNK